MEDVEKHVESSGASREDGKKELKSLPGVLFKDTSS